MDPLEAPAQAAPAPVESAPAAPAPVESAAPETTAAPVQEQTQEELDAEFRAFYQSPPPATEFAAEPEPAPAPVAATEGQAPGEAPIEGSPAAAPTAPAEPELPEHLRPRFSKPEDIAVALLAKSRGISLVEAAAIIRPAAAPGAPGAIPGMEAAPAAPAPSPAQMLADQVTTLAAEIKTERAAGDFMTAEHLDKVERLGELRTDLRLARYEEAQAAAGIQRQQQTAEASARSESIAVASREFPTSANTSTPLGANVSKVIAEWKADPAHQHVMATPTAPEAVVAEAVHRTAMELFNSRAFPTYDLAVASLKAPAAAPAPAVARPAAAPVPPAAQPAAPRRVAPASGARGQIDGGGNPPSTFGEAVAAANDIESIDALFNEAYKKGDGTRRVPLGVR